MFVGHFAVGFAAKKAAPGTSLGFLIGAPLLLDLLWPIFLYLGWESVRIDPGNTVVTPLDFVSYPYSHSLAFVLLWSALAACVYWAATRYAAGATALGLGVLSHWVLDWVSHRPDMPLWPGSPKVGLGLWGSLPATVAVELALFAGGLWLYVTSTRAAGTVGRWSFAAYVAFLGILYVSSLFGPPPPNVEALRAVALTAWLFPLWAHWFDRDRRSVPA